MRSLTFLLLGDILKVVPQTKTVFQIKLLVPLIKVCTLSRFFEPDQSKFINFYFFCDYLIEKGDFILGCFLVQMQLFHSLCLSIDLDFQFEISSFKSLELMKSAYCVTIFKGHFQSSISCIFYFLSTQKEIGFIPFSSSLGTPLKGGYLDPFFLQHFQGFL